MFDYVAVTERVWTTLPKLLKAGVERTVPLTLIAFSLGLVIAIITALVQYMRVPVLKELARIYIWIIRGTPLLVQLFIVFFGLPSIGIYVDPFPTAVLVFSINEGAYSAETMRAALESVSVGQLEAGYCVGLNFMQILFRIVLPQAFRTAFPPLFNSLISMVKDTSLAMNVTYAEMFYTAKKVASDKLDYLLIYIEVAFIYLLFSTVLSFVQKAGEKLLSRGFKREVKRHD